MTESARQIKDIVVTTPKNKMNIAAEEARKCIEAGSGFYFRTFRNKPRYLCVSSRIFYVEDGYVRGFGVVSEVVEGNMHCDTTGYDWGDGYHAVMQANSWKWLRPIPMRGFQGWQYFEVNNIKVVGNWRDQKPVVKEG